MSKYAKRIEVMDEEVRKLKVLTDSLVSKDIVSFGGGAPAKEAYPFDTLREIANDVLTFNQEGIESVKYGSAYGVTSLRETVRDELLGKRGLKTEIENIQITAGGIQPINMICQLYIDPGDVILVETPSFVHASMIYKMFEAKLVPVDMDDEGMVMEDLEAKIKEYDPKLIYTVPTFQNPTGVTLSLERRKKMAELAAKYDVVVFEDDPYREIRYSGEDLPFIRSFDTTGHVILTGSFSKIFSPGSRLGFINAEKEIIDLFADIKLGTDTCTNTLTQTICGEFFKRGYYPKHREMLCDMYRNRRDVLLKGIDEWFPEGTKHTYPDGGYYTWVTLPDGLDATGMKAEIAEKLNICYGDGSIFFTEGNPEGAGRNMMRMNFSGLDEKTIEENIKKLGEFFTSKM